MGKFNKMVDRMPQVDDKKAAMEALLSFREAIEEGVAHYTKKELLNDWWLLHYTNSRISWEKKLEKVNKSISELEKGGINVSVQADSGTTPIQELQNPSTK